MQEKLLEAYRNLALAYSYGWWRTLALTIKKYGWGLVEDEEWPRLARSFGLKEARGILKVLPTLHKVDLVAEALKLSHWALFEKVDIEVDGSKVKMRVYECSARKSLAKWRLEDYRCEVFTSAALEGFMEALGVKAKIIRVYGPPDPLPAYAPKGASCEWLVEVS
ncbi:MAG: hypothetical protein DRJ98_01300 [Thermoprotei archaeon]|nr:MAG: hypothetical protein DRJ98_01300 [Thermoprotei archaeon]RLF17137.1 MAG: hypothetical protein DRN06_04305 [Thermoprotei archaeon]